jgi:hypothetical protein
MKPLPSDDAFSQRLRDRDRCLFLKLKGSPCPLCGGRLDAANFPRKTRGMGDEDETRFSLCCRRVGCRHRVTPPSLRFLNRKVHAAWRVIMVHAFREILGISPGIARQTLARWQNFWKETLREGAPFMRWARASGQLPLSVVDSPSLLSLLQALGFPSEEGWIRCLEFFTRFPAD